MKAGQSVTSSLIMRLGGRPLQDDGAQGQYHDSMDIQGCIGSSMEQAAIEKWFARPACM